MCTQPDGGMRRLDGSTFECGVSSSIFRTTSGSKSACVILRDVSAEQRLSAELSLAERRWRLTVQHSSTGIAPVGLDGRWLPVNTALCRIVGCDDAELLSRTSRTSPIRRTWTQPWAC